MPHLIKIVDLCNRFRQPKNESKIQYKMFRIILLLFFSFTYIKNFTQIQKDTTFTINSEYKKNIKKYPFIKVPNIINSGSVKQTSNIIYKKIKDRTLKLDAYINITKNTKPALIIIHGGGWKSGNKEMQESMALEISNLGYQVFTIEYRLSDEAKYPAGINDLESALKFIIKNASKFEVNPSKIAILGCSSGAQMATLVGEKHPKKIKAIINIDGILAFHHPESQEGKYAELWLGGNYNQIPKIWEDASPLYHVSKNSPPILFINSQFDRFHAGRDDMITELNAYGIYSEIKKIENSPHSFWLFGPWFQPTIKYTTDFLNQTLNKNN